MFVTKRSGDKEVVKFEKILKRIQRQSKDLKSVDAHTVAQKVILGLYESVTTNELDNLAIDTSYALSIKNPEYDKLALRLAISRLHKETESNFSSVIEKLRNVKDVAGNDKPLISEHVYKFIKKNGHVLDNAIEYARDFNFDYFGFKTLERSYLLKIDGKIVERPQHMWMRVACGIHYDDIDACLNTYKMLSNLEATHATPTLFNSGLIKNQMSSCFMAGTKIFTLDGEKNIEDVKIGDMVITHLGNYKKVLQTHKNKLNDRNIYNLEVFGSPSMFVTGNHKFYSISKEQLKYGERPTWNDISYLRDGDFISIGNHNHKTEDKIIDLSLFNCTSNLKSVDFEVETTDDKLTLISKYKRNNTLDKTDVYVNRKHNTVNRFLKLDNDFYQFLGVWLGDGHIVTKRGSLKNNRDVETYGIAVTVHFKNQKLINWITEYSKRSFGVNARITSVNSTNCVTVSINSIIIGKYFEKQYGKGFSNKKISNLEYFDKEKVASLLDGLTTSDGCVTARGEVRISMSNKKLVKEIYNLSRAHNITICYSETDNIGRISLPNHVLNKDNIRKIYNDNRLELVGERKTNNYSIEIDGQKFIRISKKFKTSHTPDYVYTLGVEDDHSYMVEGVIAQNCFLVAMKSDSIFGIYDTLKECALISQSAGGIGIHIHDIRSKASPIYGTNGVSNGLVPMLKVFNETARYVDQGGNKRKGSIAVYLEPWHADVLDFLELRKNNGKEELRARDLNLAIWAPDLFFKRVKQDANWSLMDPNVSKGLSDVYGDEFETLYTKYETEGKFVKQIKARDVWLAILQSQIETGQPYLLAKDAGNRKTNQKNIGVIKSSNLCCEIFEVSTPEETAVCNLASISLPSFVDDKKGKKTFNHKKLLDTVKTLTENLNKIIDTEYYPVEEARRSNLRHRPIGLGVQGLADLFARLRLTWDSEDAKVLNKQIFETIYYGFLTTSCDLAEKLGAYETFKGSPASEGVLQFDMWGVEPSNQYDWSALKERIKIHGLRNSLGIAPMPTASTSQILGNTESIECITSNIYKRSTLSGEFIMVNKYLVEDLISLGIWDDNLRQKIIASDGSIQFLDEIPQEIKNLYKTVWEIPQKILIDMSADRAPFICQSQSLNLYFKDANFAKLSSAYFYGWEKGLKTIVYYTRTQNRGAQKFTVDKAIENEMKLKQQVKSNSVEKEEISCSLDNPEACEACGS